MCPCLCSECGGPLGDCDSIICVQCMLEIVDKTKPANIKGESKLTENGSPKTGD